jgi:hypothetical protein
MAANAAKYGDVARVFLALRFLLLRFLLMCGLARWEFQRIPRAGTRCDAAKTGSGFGQKGSGQKSSVCHAVIVAAGRARQIAVPLPVVGVGCAIIALDARRENPFRRRVPSGLRRRNASRGKQKSHSQCGRDITNHINLLTLGGSAPSWVRKHSLRLEHEAGRVAGPLNSKHRH